MFALVGHIDIGYCFRLFSKFFAQAAQVANVQGVPLQIVALKKKIADCTTSSFVGESLCRQQVLVTS